MKHTILLLICCWFLQVKNVIGQTTIASQDFETTPATPTWTFSNTGGNVSTATGAGDTPANQRIRTNSRSFQINNATSTITFSDINTTSYTSISLVVRLSSTSANTTNGADAADYVRLFTALNGGAFLTNSETNADIVVKGATNARWGYNNSGVSTNAGTNVVVSGTSGTNQGTIYSTLTINIPNGTTSVALRINALNNDGNEIWSIDDVLLQGTLTVTNTISAPATPSTINLANCASTDNINVNVTSNGTFNTGNQYIAQLSNASGSFASPIATATITDNTNNPPTITLTVPAGTLTGTGYKVRVISSNPSIIGAESGAFTINQSGTCASTTTDYFRSKQTGNWNTASTWESSADNINWINATLVPDNNANTILIRNSHVVTINTSVNIDQTIIQSGGTLTHSANALNIQDGAGDDLTIEGGGIFISDGALASFSGSAILRVKTNGMIRSVSGSDGARYAASGLTSPASVTNNVIWENTSIYEYAQTTIFGSSGVTYFPNVTSEIPIFRITSNVGAVGAGANTTINGIFEANGNITFQNAGTKTFRNGIRGTGTITQNASSGKFAITGTTAELSGVTLNMFSTNGLSLENNGVININSDVTISNGTIIFLNADLNLNNRNITLNGGTIQEDLANGYTVIDNTSTTEASKGGAIIYNATVTSVATNFFNAGLSLNHGGTGDYAISVRRRHYSGGFGKGIKRIYQITGTPSGTSIMTIRYADAELGLVTEPLFISRWQSATGWQSYTPDATDFTNNIVTYNNVTAFSDWTLSSQTNALPIQLISFEGKVLAKNTTNIIWKTATETNNKYFILEKSENQNNDFVKIAQIDAQGNSIQIKEYNFVDNNFQNSAYYRLIQVDENGLHKEVGLFFLKNENQISLEIYPNPVFENIYLKGEKNINYTLNIQNLEGKNIFATKGNLEFLENEIQKQIKYLKAGSYVFVFQSENQKWVKKILKN